MSHWLPIYWIKWIMIQNKDAMPCWLPNHTASKEIKSWQRNKKITKHKHLIYWPPTNNRQNHQRKMLTVMELLSKQQITQNPATQYIERRGEAILVGLRKEHKIITHKHRVKNKEPPICILCQESYVIKYLLIDDHDLKQVTIRNHRADDLKDIFLNTNPRNELNSSEISLYMKKWTKIYKNKWDGDLYIYIYIYREREIWH